jgi:cob(I)alamin adenosyltransferase
MAKIYTKTGDAGQTHLVGGARVPKSDARVEAYGDVDELSCAVGAARSALGGAGADADLDGVLAQVQRDLVTVGAELATPPGAKAVGTLAPAAIERLEGTIDLWEAELPRLDRLILPSGTAGACALHLARAACRRAERHALAIAGGPPPAVIAYLNRLSDLLFVAARRANRRAGLADEA